MFAAIRIVSFPIVTGILLISGAGLGAVYPDKFFHVVPPCAISQCFGETTKSHEGKMSWHERLQWRVVDGDTIHCERRNLRMFGYDTPEMRARGITKEKVWGQVAADRFAQLLREKRWWTEFTGVIDGRSRMIVRLRNEGRAIPSILIEEGLALPLRDTLVRPDWCRLIVRNRVVIDRMEAEMPTGPNCPQ